MFAYSTMFIFYVSARKVSRFSSNFSCLCFKPYKHRFLTNILRIYQLFWYFVCYHLAKIFLISLKALFSDKRRSQHIKQNNTSTSFLVAKMQLYHPELHQMGHVYFNRERHISSHRYEFKYESRIWIKMDFFTVMKNDDMYSHDSFIF